MEQWKQIPNVVGFYEVSNTGKVRNGKTKKLLEPRPTKNNYLRVHISNGRTRDVYIHRLVADAFCYRAYGCDIVNHIDNNPLNNNSENLEWTTQFKNVHYGMAQKRYKHNAIPVVGHKNGMDYEFCSANQASVHTGCDAKAILKCCKNIYSQSKGYKWEYAR